MLCADGGDPPRGRSDRDLGATRNNCWNMRELTSVSLQQCIASKLPPSVYYYVCICVDFFMSLPASQSQYLWNKAEYFPQAFSFEL